MDQQLKKIDHNPGPAGGIPRILDFPKILDRESYERHLRSVYGFQTIPEPMRRFTEVMRNPQQYAFVNPSALNVHVNVPLTNFAVDFARDQNVWPVERFCPSITVDKMSGKYWRFDEPEAFRTADPNSDSYAPGKGGGRPKQLEMKHDTASYECLGYAYSADLPFTTERNADFDIRQKLVQLISSALQMRKMKRATDILHATASMNNDTATNVGGGKWSSSSTSQNYIKKGIAAVVALIKKATFNSVRTQDIWCVFGPDIAQDVAVQPEILDYVKQSVAGERALQGVAPLVLDQYGIPNRLFGVNTMVLESVERTSAEGVTDVDAFVWPTDEVAFFTSTPPSLASTSTLTCLEYEPFRTEAHDIPSEHFTSLQVHNAYDIVVSMKNSGYLLTAAA